MSDTNRPPLSPAAQAVLDHFLADVEISLEHGIAAALRAAADQVVPHTEIAPQQDLKSRREAMVWGMANQTQITRRDILAIAAELESTDQSTKSTHLETDDEQ